MAPDECVECVNESCMGGFLYTSVGMMIFPTNQKCPDCGRSNLIVRCDVCSAVIPNCEHTQHLKGKESEQKSS